MINRHSRIHSVFLFSSAVVVACLGVDDCWGQVGKDDVRLIDQTPFDRIILKVAEKGKEKQYDVFLLQGVARRPVVKGEDEEKLVIRLINQPDQKYQVAWKHIERVVLFEQMVLSEATRLRDEKDYEGAYEYFQYLVRASPKFAGVKKGLESCFMAEANDRESSGDLTQSLVLLYELFKQNPDYPDLRRSLGRVIGALIDKHIETGNGPAARKLLQELREKSPQHPAIDEKENILKAKAKAALNSANESRAKGQHRISHELAETASAWWPELEGVQRIQDQLNADYPIVRVGVRELFQSTPVTRPTWSSIRGEPLLSDAFEPKKPRPGEQSFVRPLVTRQKKPREIVEHRVASAIGALRGITSGRYEAVDRIYPWERALFEGRSDVKLGEYRERTISMVLLNVSNPWLQHRELRRAIVSGVNRTRILRQELGVPANAGAVLAAPFPSQTFSAARLTPHEYDPRLMIALKRLVEQRMANNLKPLRLAYWAGDYSNRSVLAIRDQLQLGGEGIKVQLVPLNDREIPPEGWDMLYVAWAKMDPVEAVKKLSAHFALGGARVQRQLDQIRNIENETARASAIQLLASAVHNELPVIPLWESTEFFATGPDLKGISESPATLYESVSDWSEDGEGDR